MIESLTQERLKEIVEYDPVSGWFYKKDTNRIIGSIVKGYTIVTIGGQAFRAGRLAWFYMTGRWPEEIDHKDLCKCNDAWDNLREATRSQNCANRKAFNSLGIKGVSQLPSGRYSASIRHDGYNHYLGSFDTAEEASEAYKQAAVLYHGEYANS